MKFSTFSFLVALLPWPFFAFGQSTDCGCQQDFEYVVDFMEANFPGFDENVRADNRLNYVVLKEQLADQVATAQTPNDCLKYLTYYVEFFKDNHTKMRAAKRLYVDEMSTAAVAEFLSSAAFLQTETIAPSKKQQRKKYPLKDIRGIYWSTDSMYKVAIIPSAAQFRDYVGVILEARTELWTKGQVKFELQQKANNLYEGFFYNRYHQGAYQTAVPFNRGFLGSYWVKADKANPINYSLNPDATFGHVVVDSTVILRLPSFMGDHTQEIDSLYQAAQADLAKNPYLLIDVRDNGGGNSSNFSALLPYLYTKPIIRTETVELYATQGIIQLYEEDFRKIMKDSTQVNAETIQAFREGIADLKQAPLNSYVQQGEPDTLVLTPHPFPRKVGILYNRGCASACEDLLFMAQHSDKTLLLGDHSGGFVGYGNIFTVYTPCYGLGLSCSTTRYSTQWQYEVVGIAPDRKLNYNKDWIQQAIAILKNN